MRFLVNRQGKAQCPSCKQLCELEPDKAGGPCYEFAHCGRNYLIAIDNEGLKALKNGGEAKAPPSWWVTKTNNGGDAKQITDEQMHDRTNELTHKRTKMKGN